MGIRKRFLFYVLALIFALMLLIAVMARLTLRPGMAKAERESALQGIAAAEALLQQELREIDTIVADYATWDDMYAFAEDADPAFIESTFAAVTFATLNVAFGAVLREDCSPLIVRARVSKTSIAAPPEAVTEALLGETSRLRQACTEGASIAGMLRVGTITYLVACHPVHTSAGGGEVKGSVIMARELGQDHFDAISHVLGVECIRLEVPNSAAPPGTSIAFDGDVTSARKTILDLAGKPCFVLEVRERHAILSRLEFGMAVIIIVTGAACLLAAMALAVLLDQRILKPISKLGRYLRNIENAENLAGRVEVGGVGELVWLSQGVNLLLERFQVLLETSEESRRAAEASEAHFRAIFESSPVSIVLNKMSDQTFVAANAAFYQRNQLQEPELIGRTPAELGLVWDASTVARWSDVLVAKGRVENMLITTHFKGVPTTYLISSVVIPWEGEMCVLTMSIDFSVQERAENALRTSEEKLRLIVEQTGHMVYDLDIASGRIVWSGAIEALLGYTAEAFQDTDVNAWAELIHPDDRAEASQLLEDAIRTFAPYDVLYRFRRSDGSYVVMEDLGKALPDANGKPYRMLGVMRDVTDRKRVEDALSASEMHFRTLFESASDAILLMKNNLFIECNDKAEQMFGAPRHEIVGQSPIAFSPKLQSDGQPSEVKALEKMSAASSGVAQFFEWTHIRRDGTPFDAEVTLNAIELADGPCTQAIVRDVTERKRIETQLRQAQKMEAVGLLAGGVAHDFNNLLQAIMGCAHLLLRKENLDREGRELAEEMLSASERAAGLTRQLLTFSRRQVIDLKPMCIGDVLRDLMKMLRRLLGETVAIEVDNNDNPLWIYADRGQFEQVVMNLCINARDAMPDGGTLRIRCTAENLAAPRPLAGGTLAQGDYVKVTVADAGTGIDAATIARVFEPFFSTKEQGKGTGLGLATVLGIVQQHGGGVDITSTPGAGTAVDVYLPRYDGVSVAAPNAAPPVLPQGVGTVLLAEDEEHVLRLTGRLLQAAGYHVLKAANGLEALQVYRQNRNQIDLLLLDVVMPHMGGPAVLKELRAMGSTTPCIFASGYSEAEIHKDFVLSAGVELLQKPYTPEDLLLGIRRILGHGPGKR